MANSKHTKRTLLASILSVAVCVTMLVGSTFAWFTDSVTSGNNKIVAGNLDIKLSYSTDLQNWNDVDANTNVFKEGTLWEPGHTEVVYLRVSNAGSLALKYKFAINVADKVIGQTADGKDIDLSNFIKFGIVTAPEIAYSQDVAGRAAAVTAVAADAQLVSAGYFKEGTMVKGAAPEVLAMVVYMPEEVGSEANHGTGKQAPSINMGISLVATQDTVEKDSFDNQYDKDALYDGQIATSDALAAAMQKGGEYQLVSNMELETPLTVNQGVNFALDLNGKTITGIFPKSKGPVFQNDGELTLTGGTIKSTVGNGGSAIKNNGTLTIDGTAIYGAPQEGEGWSAYGVNNAGDMTIKNATIETTHGAIAAYGGGTFTVDNGTFTAFKGGTFAKNPTAYVDTERYAVTQSGDLWTVTAK